MKHSLLAITLVLALCLAVPAHAGDVKVQLANGRVTLQARNATVREILEEWARVGQVKILNADKVMSAPITLELQDVPETQALNVVLRNVSGYVAVPRIGGAQEPAGAIVPAAAPLSAYSSIIVMSAPRSVSATPSLLPATQTTTTPTMPVRPMLPPGMNLDDDQPPPGYPRGMFNPPPQPAPQPNAPVPGQVPTGAPGTVSPMPQSMQPGAPGAPGAVSKPGNPGGPGGKGDPDLR